MINKEFERLLEGNDENFEITYLGSGYKLDVFQLYPKGENKSIAQIRFSESKVHIVRFDLPESTISPCPLIAVCDDDGDSWSAPGWDTMQGFMDSLEKYPLSN